MLKIDFPDVVKDLISELKQLPGVGPRSAERIAVWMIQHPKANSENLAEALRTAESQVKGCKVCGFFMDEAGCSNCNASNREEHVLCVVEQPTDVLPLERAGVFRGRYHCLGGKLAPLDNVTPEDLKISELMKRVSEHPGIEVILALTTDVEGDATANYLANLLESEDCKVTRIAQGLPAGGGVEHADELTLIRALQGRR